MLAPATDMPLKKYLGLLEELADPRVSVKLNARRSAMQSDPGFKTNVGEWRTIMMSLHYTRDHLSAAAQMIEDEDEQLITYDHLERLDRLIPRMEREFSDALDRDAKCLTPPALVSQA